MTPDAHFFSFWTPEQGASLLSQTCSGPVGRKHALALAEALDPRAQCVADFLQWHITGIQGAQVVLSGTAHALGTRWSLRVQAQALLLEKVRQWVHQQGHERPDEWAIAA